MSQRPSGAADAGQGREPQLPLQPDLRRRPLPSSCLPPAAGRAGATRHQPPQPPGVHGAGREWLGLRCVAWLAAQASRGTCLRGRGAGTPAATRCTLTLPPRPARPLAGAGGNDKGQLGVGDTADVAEPQSLKVARRWAALSMGSSHAAGVTGQGEVYTWGLNDKGQLGAPSGPGDSKDAPRRMELLVGWNVK